MIAAVVPLQRRSVRLPDKNGRPLHGKPVMSYILEAAHQAKGIDAVIVATESNEIAALAQQYGAEVVSNPPELAEDTVSPLDVVEFALKNRSEITTLVLTFATMPLLCSADIEGCVGLFIHRQPPGVVAVDEVPVLFWRMAARITADERMAWIHPTVGLRQCGREEIAEAEGRVYRPAGIGVVSRETFLRYGSVYVPDMLAYLVPKERAVDINDEIDFAVAECLLARREQQKVIHQESA